MRPSRALALLTAVSALVVPAAAGAVEQEGTGVDVRHVKNIPYPNLHAPDEVNAGTDLEFVTLTVPSPAVVTPVATPAPGAAAPTATPTPGATTKPRPKPKPRKTTVPKKCRKLKKGSKKRARCIAAERRKAAARKKAAAKKKAAQKKKAARRDARPQEPGLQRTFAFAGSYGDGLQVIDVTDPENSVLVATWDCGISQGDVQIFTRADLGGRTFVAFTQDDGYDFHPEAQCAKDLVAKGVDLGDPEAVAGTFIADISDPYHPRTVSYVPFEQGSHNQTVHPSGRYLYNSNSDLITSILPAVEIADITDLEHPKVVGEVALKSLPGLGTESHDIGFSADGTRAYVAALSHGEILDTTDPVNPKPISTIVDPAVNVWHEAEPISIEDPILGKRDFLIAEDEFLGAIGTGQCPNGGVHVYDITGPLEQTPVKVGTWNIADVGPTNATLGGCTAHVFQLHRKEQLMTIAYYNGGVRVVDLTGLVGVALGRTGVGMKELGSYLFPDSDTWAVKAPFASRDGFYLYGNDHARGFDVYEYAPTKTGARKAAAEGMWLTPAQARERAARALRKGAIQVATICLLTPQRLAALGEQG